ncbi:hypothetical protein [Colwellia sp.]|uniref:beta strand repeat-containing protein n=1 Tax=Colwellia sp. TaxID=56799 RepID=UPI0025BD7A1F|nr:hypothetical protein [Colwellia sp.]
MLGTVNQTVEIGTDISGIETVTGLGSNELIASNIDNTWLINTTDQGVINDGTINEVNFVNFDKLTGGNQADDFSLTLMDNITGLISGGTGVDSLILGTVNQMVEIGIDISGIETVTGLGSNELIASNIDNTWLINTTDQGVINDGTADEVNFFGFDKLTGGNQVDDFTLTLMDNITGLISGGSGDDTLILNTVNQSVVIGTDISGIETVTGQGSNTLTASNIDNTWLINAADQGVINDGTVNEVNFVNFTNLVGGSGDDDFTLATRTQISGSIDGGGETTGDSYTVTMASQTVNLSTFTDIEEVFATSGINTLEINSGDNIWTIDKENEGSVEGVKFAKFSYLEGGDGNDTFNVIVGGKLTSIKGNLGDDTISLVDLDSVDVIDGGDHDIEDILILNVSGQTLSLANINVDNIEVINGNGNDLQAENGQTNTWQITGANSGLLNGISFTNFIHLLGGNQQDNFTIATTAIGTITLDGGTGTNTLTGSDNDSSWAITDTNEGTVSGFSFVNISELTGGSADDIFAISAAIESIDSGAGDDKITINSAVVDGAIETLTLGANDDELFIARLGQVQNSIEGNDGNDTLNLTTAGETLDLADISSFESYVGTGDNTLAATNGENTWAVTSSNTGTVKLGSGTTNNFTGFSDLVGGWSKDVFDVSAAINSITAGYGNDEVTITTIVADSIGTVDLGDDDDTLKIADMASIVNVIQGGRDHDSLELTGTGEILDLAKIIDFEEVTTLNSNTLQASDGENIWAVTADNQGTVKLGAADTIDFYGFTDLVGGADKDTFTVSAAINSISSMAGDDVIIIDEFVLPGSIANIDAGDNDDRIDVHSADSVSSLIIGGLGDDILGITNSDQKLTLAIVDSSIETLDGKNANNTLVGEGDSVWDITGAKAGEILGVNFINFDILEGGSGTDNFILKTADTGDMLLDGAGGVNTITGFDNATTWNVLTDNAGNVAGFDFSSINHLIGGTGVDKVYVSAAMDSISTGAGNDEVTIYASVATGAITALDLGANNDTLTIAKLDSVIDVIKGGDDYDSLELTGTAEILNLADISGFEEVTTLSASTNTLQASDGENIWFVTADNKGTVKLGAADAIDFDGFTDLVGGADKDTFTVSAAINSISSMAGEDEIIIEDVGAGSINNINAGDDNDRIDVYSADSVSSLIVGGAGIDILGITNSVQTLTLDILDNSIETLDGNNLNNTLAGETNGDNVWNITGTSSGNIQGVNFINFATLLGGDETDNYVLKTADTGNMILNGAGGVNTITGSDNATTWNVLNDNAGNVAGFTFKSINNLVGGTGVDKVNVSAAMDSISTGAGNDEVTLDDLVATGAITSLDLGANDDTLTIAKLDSVTDVIKGGDDHDSLELTSTGEILNLAKIINFEEVTTLNSNTLQASDGENIWFVTADNQGTVKLGAADAIDFYGFTDLVGGADKDTFTVSAAINSISSMAGDDEITLNSSVIDNAITTIDLGDDSDTLHIENLASVQNRIEAGDGTDTIYLTGDSQTLKLADINNFEELHGLSSNTLQGRDEENTWQVTADNSGNVNGINFTNFTQLVGGTNKDNFTISAGISTINSGAGEDSIVVDSNVGVNAITNINTGDDNDNITLHDINSISGLVDGGAGNNNTLTFTQDGQVVNLVSDVNHIKSITGVAGTNTLVANDEANTWIVDALNSGHLTNVSYSDGINFVNFNQLEGGSEIDNFTINTLVNISGYINGNGNNDTLVLQSADQQVILGSNVNSIESISALVAGNNQLTASDTENDWLITDLNQGAITVNNASTISFSGFENITGGAQRDNFTFSSIDSDITGVISGGSGTDKLVLQVNKDYVIELGSDVTSNLNINEIENISANTSATNTLIADDVDNVWLIDKARGGSLTYGTAVTFTNIDNFYGGAGKDTVTVNTGNSANGVSLINMGSGDDSFIGVSGKVTNLVGGIGNDNFTLTKVNIEDHMDGGEGIDTITYLEDVSVTIGDDIIGFESLIATTENSVINGQSGADSSWTVSSLNTGYVTDSATQQTALAFTGFSTINGSDGVDSIFIQENGALSGIINGNDGNDILSVELNESRNTVNTSVRFDGGNGNDIVSINGVSAQYSEIYNPNVEYNSEQFDQLSYNRNNEASVAIYYRDVAVVIDDIATISLTLNSTEGDKLFIEQGMFSATSASVDVLMNSQNKGDIIVQASSGSSIELTDSLVVDGNLSLSGDTVSQLQGIVQADSLTLNNVTLLGAADKALSVDVDEVNVNVHSGDIYLNELNDIRLGQMNEVTGNITITSATGNISSSGAVTSSGNFILAAAQAINLTEQNAFTGVLSLTAGTELNLVNNSDTTINYLSANTVDIKSSGDVTSTGDFIVENATNDATASIESSLGSINLAGFSSVNNLIVSADGAISLSGTSTFNSATLVASSTITIENVTTDTLILQAGNDIDLSTLMANSLSAVSTNGSILSTEALTIGASVDGTSLILTANNGDVSLTNANNDFGQISIIANNAEIIDVNSITILGSELAGDLKLTATGDVLVGDIIAGNSIYIESKEGAIQSKDSNLTTVELMLRAYSGIGNADFDTITSYGDVNSSAINTNTSVLSAINNGEEGIINIVNSEEVSIADLRNNGDIIFTNTGDITLKITDVDESTLVQQGAIDAHYNGDTQDLEYAGRIKIFNNGDNSIYTDRSFNSPLADITGESLEVNTIIFFGTQSQPIKLRLNSSLELLNQSGSVAYIYPKPLVINTTGDLSDTSSLAVLTSRNLLEVESLDEVDPAIFSDIKNYNVDNLSILLPRDQRDYDDEKKESEEE